MTRVSLQAHLKRYMAKKEMVRMEIRIGKKAKKMLDKVVKETSQTRGMIITKLCEDEL